MNPRLVKFAVELQTNDKIEEKQKSISFKKNTFGTFYDNKKLARVTVPILKD